MSLLVVLSVMSIAQYPTVARLQNQSTEVSGTLSDYRCELGGKYGNRSTHKFELNHSDSYLLSIGSETFGCGDFPGPKSSLKKAISMRVNADGEVLTIKHGGKQYLDINSFVSDKQKDVISSLIGFALIFPFLFIGYKKSRAL